MEDVTSSHEIWEILKAVLVNPREQRLAYLLFHCGLSPRVIVRCCPQEWSDVQEIASSKAHHHGATTVPCGPTRARYA